MDKIKSMKSILKEKQSYAFTDLCDIVRILRSDEGCPWDREQDHKSIRNDLIEETYEAIEAIDNSDQELLREELGDVLLQVVFHSVIEEENETFNINNVIDDISKKLIHRHPHVFGNIVVKTSDQVLQNWDKIKNNEKSRNTVYDSMKSIPPMLPELMRARKIGSRAAKVGFDFACAEDALSKVREETNEVSSAIGSDHVFEEIGDLLFSVVNVSRKLGIDPEEALHFSNEKFMMRFKGVEDEILKDRGNFSSYSLSELDDIYNKVKNSKLL